MTQETILTLFSSLKAEDEIPWLSECFIPPAFFEQMLGTRSCIILGKPGSGKTALYQALKKFCVDDAGQVSYLDVRWRPKSFPENANDAGWIREQVLSLFDECALAVVKTFLAHSFDLDTSPSWVQKRIAWFVQTYLQGDLDFRIGPIIAAASNGPKVKEYISANIDNSFHTEPMPEQVILELMVALKHYGIQGIWVIADDIQEWIIAEKEKLDRGLVSFLSTLSLFENSQLAFKYMLPLDLEVAISHAGGLIRRRIDKYYLTWDKSSLIQIIEKRLAYAMDTKSFSLSELCNEPEFLVWLENVGGNEPREWLDLVCPLFLHYHSNHLVSPIAIDIFDRLRLETPPRIYLDEKMHTIKIGGKTIPLRDISPKEYSLLAYLYRNADRVISKEELYYLAFRELDVIPIKESSFYEDPNLYKGTVDTYIHRLRQVIEPDAAKPILLQTERGFGIRLRARW